MKTGPTSGTGVARHGRCPGEPSRQASRAARRAVNPVVVTTTGSGARGCDSHGVRIADATALGVTETASPEAVCGDRLPRRRAAP